MKIIATGEARRRLKSRNGQSLLLEPIWWGLGGNRASAELLDVHQQDPVNWRYRGRVPTEEVGIIAKKLGLPVEALSYEIVASIKGEATLSWKATVDKVLSVLGLALSKDSLNAIYKQAPKTYKELLNVE